MSASSVTREYLIADFSEKFHLDPLNVPFVGPYYWRRLPNGSIDWRIKDLVTAGMYCVIIGVVSSMILYFAIKIYFHMKNATAHLSQKTLDLNRQLFIMLTVQTIVPCVLMYIPIGFILGFPLFNLSLGGYENCASASIAIYPMIEPLIAMYCITDFRRTILGFLGIKKYSSKVYSTTSEGTGASKGEASKA